MRCSQIALLSMNKQKWVGVAGFKCQGEKGGKVMWLNVIKKAVALWIKKTESI